MKLLLPPADLYQLCTECGRPMMNGLIGYMTHKDDYNCMFPNPPMFPGKGGKAFTINMGRQAFNIYTSLEKIWPEVKVYIKIEKTEDGKGHYLSEFSCELNAETDYHVFTGLGGWYNYHKMVPYEYNLIINGNKCDERDRKFWIGEFLRWHDNSKKLNKS